MDADEVIAMMEKGAKAQPPAQRKAMSGPTLRERYRRTMFFQRVDRLPNFEFGYWAETLTEWHKQGLPREIDCEAKAYEYFGIENWKTAPINVMGLKPGFEHVVLEESDDYCIYRDGEGVTAKINKVGHKSIPHYIEFPIKERKDWEAFRERLQPSADRIPANWKELAEAYNQRDYPLAAPIGSLIGRPRNWIGFENIALMVYDDPDLLEEMVETLCQLVLQTLEPCLRDVEFDFGTGWEDICFNSGPIVGVEFMNSIVAPRYKRITDLLTKQGCVVAWTDCDGNVNPILDCFRSGGINCLFPVEVHGGTDPVAIRKRFPDIRFQGGFCKMRLAEDKASIRKEMERLLPVVREGGFIPGVDHRVQADVPLENYKYYLKLKRDLFGVGGMPQYDESRIG